MRNLVTLLILVNCIGCSTLSHKNKTLAYMAGAFAGGAVIGASTAHEDDNKNMHGVLWGSAAAAVVGAVMAYTYDENSELKAREFKIREMEARLSDFKKNSVTVSGDGKSDFMEARLPKDYRHLVKPGKWKLYKIDEWKKTPEGELVHQDKLLEISPATVTIEQ